MARDYRALGGVPISSVDVTSGKRGCYTVVITPLDAQRLLDNNSRNRKISANTVARYAQMMDDGEWDWCDGDGPLKFGAGGVLRNGQHRLSAQVMANVTGAYDIRTGVPEESYKVMDTAKPRSLADYFYGKEYPTQVSAMGNRIVAARHGLIRATGAFTMTTTKGAESGSHRVVVRNKKNTITRLECIEFVEGHYDELIQYIRLGARIRLQNRVGGEAIYASALYINQVPFDEAEQFVSDYVQGDKETSITKATLLKKLVNKDFKPKAEWFAGAIIMAHDAWREGRPVKVFKTPEARYKNAVDAYCALFKPTGEVE